MSIRNKTHLKYYYLYQKACMLHFFSTNRYLLKTHTNLLTRKTNITAFFHLWIHLYKYSFINAFEMHYGFLQPLSVFYSPMHALLKEHALVNKKRIMVVESHNAFQMHLAITQNIIDTVRYISILPLKSNVYCVYLLYYLSIIGNNQN